MPARGAVVAFAVLALAPAALAAYGPPKQAGTITAEALPEVSGLTAASALSGGWWVLNDSGNPPDLHLISAKGKLVATVGVSGASNGDWEDLASAPAPGGRRFLYIGDIGDNDHARDDLVVYRVLEPARDARAVAAKSFPFRYPDGRHNAEALFVDPASGRVYVVTKSDLDAATGGALYRFPLPLRPGRRVTLKRVGGPIEKRLAALPLITGAGLSPDGTRLAIRTYVGALEWRRSPNAPFAGLFGALPEPVALALEPQGEAIAYASDGKSLVTTSEQLPAPLWRLLWRSKG